MKYIRTKDGRIVKVEEHMMIKETTLDGVQKCFRLVYKNRPFTCVLRGDEDYIINQADTIEELCDEFVEVLDLPIDSESFKHCIHNTPVNREKLLTFAHLPNKVTLYGAIWTDKGLIYVAKMNKKGELELL